MEFATHYRPSDEQEVYDFMNVLDDRLSHSNSAVVMATVKMFLHYTLSMPATHQQVQALTVAGFYNTPCAELSAGLKLHIKSSLQKALTISECQNTIL